jgi:hypothetical protein
MSVVGIDTGRQIYVKVRREVDKGGGGLNNLTQRKIG